MLIDAAAADEDLALDDADAAETAYTDYTTDQSD